MKHRWILIACVLGVALAACGGTTKVGEGISAVGGGKGGALGKFVDQPSKKATVSATPKASTKAKTSADQKKQDVKNASITVVINLSGYDSYYIRVFVGSIVAFTNKDAQARTVTADNGEFDSKSIKPGDVWPYRATMVGKFLFHDDTRPYVVGTLEVLPK